MWLGRLSALNITVFCYEEVRIKPGLTGLPSSLCPVIVACVQTRLTYPGVVCFLLLLFFAPLYLFITGAQNRQSIAEMVRSRALWIWIWMVHITKQCWKLSSELTIKSIPVLLVQPPLFSSFSLSLSLFVWQRQWWIQGRRQLSLAGYRSLPME